MEREQTTLRLPVALLEQLRQEAHKKGHSLNNLIARLVNIGWAAYISDGN